MKDRISPEGVSKKLKRRIFVLIVTSTTVVALTFGLSFYFALLSNETAVAKQVPELVSLAATLKRIMLINTFAFAAVIIASLYALSSLITTRMFRPLESMMRDLLSIGKGTLPLRHESTREEPFAGFDEMFSSVLSVLQDRERKEIDNIQRCISGLSDRPDTGRIRQTLETMLREKRSFIGAGEETGRDKKTADEDEALFMQPV